MAITINRKPIKFSPDFTRVIARFFMTNEERTIRLIKRVIAMPDDIVTKTLSQVLRDFSKRHRNISKVFDKDFDKIKYLLDRINVSEDSLSTNTKLLIGSYCTMEYSIESAAFFNPSIIEDPDQSELNDGQKRVIVSFRATGEGHISSIVFRSSIIDKNGNIEFEPAGALLDEPEHVHRFVYNKNEFLKKLDEMQVDKNNVPWALIMDQLGENFTYGELQGSIASIKKKIKLNPSKEKVIDQINWLADSHYEISFSLDTAISERVIFPVSYSESNGIEDARFVKFTEDDGSINYYATYTAYNGYTILPKLLQTKDFYNFKILPLHGEAAQNKGMALFPRKIKGKYCMVSRIDGVNNYIMCSDRINVWNEVHLIQKPRDPWEFIQIGNCGSPVETEKGWLLIYHGVGPVREYCLGALLLDLKEPSKVIGRMEKPMIIPNKEEREGYVPNVVYSCGSIIHNDHLVIPYAMSDYASTIATIPLNELLDALTKI